ncbi:MAG: hypothetical protein HY822_05830 [Acidobacteria bacterium]|nr:hypothetical protein [Acidobacteriota bacterium]
MPSERRRCERSISSFGAWFMLALAAVFVAASAQSTKPISYPGLTEALRLGGLRADELVQFVQLRGVDFELNAEREAGLKAAGATPALIEVVRASRRGLGPARTIRDVRRIFVDKMPDELDKHIKAEIARQIRTLRVVTSRSQADAIMKGTVQDRGGTGATVTGGYLGMKNTATGAVSVLDARSGVEMWKSEAGDRTPIVGALSRGGPKKVAERLVSNLKKALE